MHVAPVDILLIVIYCAFVLAIGFRLRRQMVGSAEFRPQRELQVTSHKANPKSEITNQK
jgi:hypothetical protein